MDSPAEPDKSAELAITILGARPPMPPAAIDPDWTWTAQRLKAVYLEAFTDIEKKKIAEMVGVHVNTLFQWRKQGDYKRYMAELVYSDGVAETVQRNKTRKSVADALLKAIMTKLETPGALAGEKVSAMIKTFNDLLNSLGEDVAEWKKISEQAQAGRPVAQDGSDMAAYIRGIDDPEERERLRGHLLQIFKAQIDKTSARGPRPDTGIIDAETVPGDVPSAPESATESENAAAEPERAGELSPSDLE